MAKQVEILKSESIKNMKTKDKQQKSYKTYTEKCKTLKMLREIERAA